MSQVLLPQNTDLSGSIFGKAPVLELNVPYSLVERIRQLYQAHGQHIWTKSTSTLQRMKKGKQTKTLQVGHHALLLLALLFHVPIIADPDDLLHEDRLWSYQKTHNALFDQVCGLIVCCNQDVHGL